MQGSTQREVTAMCPLHPKATINFLLDMQLRKRGKKYVCSCVEVHVLKSRGAVLHPCLVKCFALYYEEFDTFT